MKKYSPGVLIDTRNPGSVDPNGPCSNPVFEEVEEVIYFVGDDKPYKVITTKFKEK